MHVLLHRIEPPRSRPDNDLLSRKARMASAPAPAAVRELHPGALVGPDRGAGEADGHPAGAVRTFLADDDGTIWIGTYGGGLARFRDGAFGLS